MMRPCERCSIPFHVSERNKAHVKKRFCSRQCWLLTYNTVGAEHSRKGAAIAGAANITRLRGIGSSYVKEYGRHQHRVVAEQVLGRTLQSGEVVHHRDRNRKNNDPSNLEVTTQSEHIREHLPMMLQARREKHGY